jgi:hypothetical protein
LSGTVDRYASAAFLASAIRVPFMLRLVSIARIEVRSTLAVDAATASDSAAFPLMVDVTWS